MALILVVEDEDILRPLFKEMLNQGGYDDVVAVGSGMVAVNVCQEMPVALVITDLGLPDMGGLDLIHSLRDSHPDLPIVAISGTAVGNSLEVATQLGAIATLQKPFDYGELLAVVGKIFGEKNGTVTAQNQ
jgi:CheY-like chemotaxis protein